jgi:hypothetical protein
MSAELNTNIILSGTENERLEQMKIIRDFCNTKNDVYFHLAKVRLNEKEYDLDNETTDDMLSKFVSTEAKTEVELYGPRGAFDSLGDVDLFEAMAVAAPCSSFEGKMSGFVTGADVSLKGVLSEGMLHLYESYVTNEAYPEMYLEKLDEIIPYDLFCSLFKVDEEALDEDEYSDLLLEIEDEGFPNIDYDTFLDYFGVSEIDEDAFGESLDEIRKRGFVSYDEFVSDMEASGYFVVHTVFDPKTKQYFKDEEDECDEGE